MSILLDCLVIEVYYFKLNLLLYMIFLKLFFAIEIEI